ncbi:glutathione S-transferase family protein [Acinetobacter sp. SAAs474]|uniref:glutathione S-transferase family protein n=1 Tax=Acinetobacter sp. SAAs474 TaxID=3036710 RepID=UPI0029347918|nr:glutathione S-transferase C-terminal domain-containing protein [Acinetobacter sp. SAAs474]WOE37332.1 glutathione S-transferase C-terminal domain-containing protein [Acinetobacter sp. SAAs474]
MGYGHYDTAYEALIRTLTEASPYLCGEQFTAADVYLGAYLLFQSKMGQIKAHPSIEKYLNTLRERAMLKKSPIFF